MSTHCGISVLCSDGKIRSVYCHFDGYLEGVGKELKEKFNTQSAAEKLISEGHLSTVVNNVRSYHAWRGEEIVVYEYDDLEELLISLKEDSYEYEYYFDGNKWFNIQSKPSLVEY